VRLEHGPNGSFVRRLGRLAFHPMASERQRSPDAWNLFRERFRVTFKLLGGFRMGNLGYDTDPAGSAIPGNGPQLRTEKPPVNIVPANASPLSRAATGPWLLAALAAVLLAVAAYANGLTGEFVLDDRPFLVDNPQLTDSHEFSYFFARDVYSYSNLPDVHSPNYRPLYFATLWLGNVFWPGAPLGYHLFSLALHIATTVLLLAAIPRLLPGTSPLAAGVGACLFAVHPVHSEAVAWITPFTHLMATALVLASYLVHYRYQGTRNPAALALAGFLFLLALFSNEMATGFPVFILVHDWIRYDRPRPLGAVPYFLILGVYILIRNIVLTNPFPLVFSDPAAWLRFPVFLAEYLRQL
jgi:hypothetical protein